MTEHDRSISNRREKGCRPLWTPGPEVPKSSLRAFAHSGSHGTVLGLTSAWPISSWENPFCDSRNPGSARPTPPWPGASSGAALARRAPCTFVPSECHFVMVQREMEFQGSGNKIVNVCWDGSIFRLRTHPEGQARAVSCRPSSVLVPGSALGSCRHGALSSAQAICHRKRTHNMPQ
jgi:hypothetical protein